MLWEEIPSSELDCLEELIHWKDLRQHLRIVAGDYDNISMFKILLLTTWYTLADEAVSHAVTRDLVCMKFGNFTLAGCLCGNVCLFAEKVVEHNLFKALLR